MASKKERKVLRREGVPSSGSDVHKLAELEACQRLLEMGCVGPRLYNGPHIAGTFYTFQDRLLDEVKWLAVDVFEQKKLAVAHCRLISSSIHKYWLERSRGCLSEAAGMVQSYWKSVANEVRAPGQSSNSGVFKLGSLQGMGPLTSTFSSTSPSLVPTPSEDEMPKALLKTQVLQWLDTRAALNPPTAETSTSMAEYCVQVVKHETQQITEHHSDENSTPIMVSDPGVLDFHIPVDPFLATSREHRSAQLRAIDGAVQSSIAATRGADCGPESLPDDFLLRPCVLEPEKQRAVLIEILATNVMSRNPQLFRLAVVSTSAKDSAVAKHKNVRRVVPELPMVPSKHYFVSVIFSSFRPLPWTAQEDEQLLAQIALLPLPINWALVASVMPALRTPTQCHDRYIELQQEKGSKKQKSRQVVHQPVSLAPRREVFRLKKIVCKSFSPEIHTIDVPEETSTEIIPFERQGLTVRRVAQKVLLRGAAMASFTPAKTGGYTRMSASPTKQQAVRKPLANSPSPPAMPEDKIPKRRILPVLRPAFALEDMLRKNACAVASLTPQFLAGEEVCAKHPSFANISRIAEITLTRLVNSLEEGGTVTGPVSVKDLFGYCAKFRLKYPAIFTSHQTPQKPFMPPLRQMAPAQAASKMLTRAMTHSGSNELPQPTNIPPLGSAAAKTEPSMENLAAAGPAGPGWIQPRRSRGTPR